MRSLYDSEVYNLLDRFYKATATTRTMIARNQNVVENMLISSNLTTDETLTHIDDTLFKFSGDQMGNYQYNIHRLCHQFIENCEKMYEQMRLAIESVSTQQSSRLFSKLLNRYNRDLKSIGQTDTNIAAVLKSLNEMLVERQKLQESNLREISALRNEKAYFTECFELLDERFRQETKKDSDRLRLVCSAAHESIKVGQYRSRWVCDSYYSD